MFDTLKTVPNRAKRVRPSWKNQARSRARVAGASAEALG